MTKGREPEAKLFEIEHFEFPQPFKRTWIEHWTQILVIWVVLNQIGSYSDGDKLVVSINLFCILEDIVLIV